MALKQKTGLSQKQKEISNFDLFMVWEEILLSQLPTETGHMRLDGPNHRKWPKCGES